MARLIDNLTIDEKRSLVNDIIAKKMGLNDSDWSEIISQYDINISSDQLRKAANGVMLVNDAKMMGEEPASIKDPAGYIERQMMRDLVTENNKVYRAEARTKALAEAVANAAKCMDPFPPIRTDRKKTAGKNSMVVALGDIHFGEEMETKDFFGHVINVYGENVFIDRMTELASLIEDIVDKEKPSEIHIMIVGDCISGMLRASQLQNLRYGIVDSTMKFSEYLAGWLNQLSEMFIPIQLHIVDGNHDEVRPLGSKAGEFPKDNMSKIITWYLEARLAGNDVITVHTETGRFHYVDVQGYGFLMLHGDGGKIQDICRDAVNVYGTAIDYFVCGHLHHEEEIAAGATKDGNSTIIRVPSLCGMDGYAQKLGRFSRPGATAMIIEEGYGRRCVYPIVLK